MKLWQNIYYLTRRNSSLLYPLVHLVRSYNSMKEFNWDIECEAIRLSSGVTKPCRNWLEVQWGYINFHCIDKIMWFSRTSARYINTIGTIAVIPYLVVFLMQLCRRRPYCNRQLFTKFHGSKIFHVDYYQHENFPIYGRLLLDKYIVVSS